MIGKCVRSLVLLIPFYVWPTSELYSELAAAGDNAMAIMTGANSGPPDAGTMNLTIYDNAFKQLADSNVRLVGYVHMNYGQRSMADVTKDVRQWYAQHGGHLTGIFVDEAPTEVSPDSLAYYKVLSQEIKAHGGSQLMILNPGVPLDRQLASQADIVVTFEQSWQEWLTTRLTGLSGNFLSATRRKGATKSAVMVHGTDPMTASALRQQLRRARSAGYSYAYFTDATLPNPWSNLPSYWHDEVAALRHVQKH